MSEWSAPAKTASSASGSTENGSGGPASTADVLFGLTIALHFLAVVAALVVIGFNFGWLWVSLGFVGVTIFWIVWLRRYQEQAAQKIRDAAIMESRKAASRFSDPRTSRGDEDS